MAEIKDKIVTVESLSVLHEHNKDTYVAKTDIIPIENGGTGASKASDALTNLGLTATAEELNYCDGVTSNIQTQLNDKANSSHGIHVTYGESVSELGTASAGSASTVSRSDHVHALPELTSCIGTLTLDKGGTGATTAPDALVNLGLTATAEELNYCDGVTSNIQMQLDDKSDSGHTHDYLPLSGGMLTNTLNVNGLVLTNGVDYGDEFPAAGTVGKVFFKKVSI